MSRKKAGLFVLVALVAGVAGSNFARSAESTPPPAKVTTSGRLSSLLRSEDYSSNPLSERALIIEGGGQRIEIEIPKKLLQILQTCVHEGELKKGGLSDNSNPALDLYIRPGSMDRVIQFALTDEGVPIFHVLVAGKNVDAAKKIGASGRLTYKISTPTAGSQTAVVPVQAATPAPPKPVEKRTLYRYDGQDITGPIYNNNGLGTGYIPQWAIDALSEEEYNAMKSGNWNNQWAE